MYVAGVNLKSRDPIVATIYVTKVTDAATLPANWIKILVQYYKADFINDVF